jgi:hypothetical protein
MFTRKPRLQLVARAAAFCGALGRFAYICAVPPSTNSSIPVTKLESSDARKSAAAAISCG